MRIIRKEVCWLRRAAYRNWNCVPRSLLLPTSSKSKSQSSGKSLLISPNRYLTLLRKLNLTYFDKQQIEVRVIRKEVGWSWRVAYRNYKCVSRSPLFPRSRNLDSELFERKCADFDKPHVETTIVFRDVCRADILARFLARLLLMLLLRVSVWLGGWVASLARSNETLVENLNLTVSCSLKSVNSND